MFSNRDKQTGYIYKLSKSLEDQIGQACNSEQHQTTINLASDSDDEQEIVISTTTSDALLASLQMTCPDSEDSSNVLPGLTEMPSAVGLHNESSMPEFEPFMSMFTSLSKQIANFHEKTDRVQKDASTFIDRLERVEEKVGISLETLKKVKDIIVKNVQPSEKSNFIFKTITNEEEFTAFDSKLGTDKKYYENIKKRLNNHIQAPDPNNRMHQMIDLIFDRTFMAQCSWFGTGKNSQKRIAFGQRKNILKLFEDIGSHKFTTISEMYVKKFLANKVRHAKKRLNMKQEFSVCHKRIRNMATAMQTK